MIQQLREIQELFGGGALAAMVAVLLVAVSVLFWRLQASHREHLKTALMLAPIAEKLRLAVQEQGRVAEQTAAAVSILRPILEREGRRELLADAYLPPKPQEGSGNGSD